MASPRGRRAPHFLLLVSVLIALPGAAFGGKNDLQLINLCGLHAPPAGTLSGQVQECSWVQRTADGHIAKVNLDAEAQSSYRSLMSELGAVIAPRLQTPADTLGYAGFQFSAELGFTKISNDKPFWDGVAGVDPLNRSAARPDAYLTTVGGFVRKGLWLPLPAFEFGAGAVNILGSRMYAMQGYAKMALREGFHKMALPSLAVRASVSQLLGTDQVDLTVFGVDVLISKAFSLGGTARVEPFAGWNILFIDARSGVIDATPGCDAYAVRQTAAGSPAPSSSCASAQNGSWDDLNANFAFPQQDVITRQRWFGGLKLKLSVLFLVGEYDVFLAGHSHDDSSAGAGAGDGSGTQQSFSLSAGFDF
jgi:hypothetical protein